MYARIQPTKPDGNVAAKCIRQKDGTCVPEKRESIEHENASAPIDVFVRRPNTVDGIWQQQLVRVYLPADELLNNVSRFGWARSALRNWDVKRYATPQFGFVLTW